MGLIPDVNFDEDSNLIGAFDLDDHFVDQEDVFLNYIHHGDNYIFVTINQNHTVDFSAVGNWSGEEYITFRAEDMHGAIREYTITVTVNPVNDAPVISGLPDQECKVNVLKVLDVRPFISDVDDPLESLTLLTNSTHVTAQGHDLLFSYDEGTKETVNITVSDGFLQDSITIEVTVWVNNAPYISIIPDLVVQGGEVYLFSFLPYASDKDNAIDDLQIWTDSGYIGTNPYDNMLVEIGFPVGMIGEEVVVTVFVSDGLDISSTEMFIYITNESIPKLIYNLPELSFEEDSVLSNALNLSDYFQNALNYISFGNEDVNITIEDGRVSLSAAENWSGAEMVTFRGVLGDAFV